MEWDRFISLLKSPSPSPYDLDLVEEYAEGLSIDELLVALNTPGINKRFFLILQMVLEKKVQQLSLDKSMENIVKEYMKKMNELPEPSKGNKSSFSPK